VLPEASEALAIVLDVPVSDFLTYEAGAPGYSPVPTASIQGLVALARATVERPMSEEECRFYLRVKACPRATVPDVVGSTEEAAGSTLDAAGFRVVVAFRRATSDPEKDGTVLVQDPTRSATVVVGSTVALVIARYSRP
jgi:PASTA domain